MYYQHTTGPMTSSLQGAIQALLSSTRQFRENFEASMSAIPHHPYERLKWEYFQPNEQFLKIEDIPVPNNFCPLTCTKELSGISANFNRNVSAQVSALTCEDSQQTCNAFATLSDNVFVVDTEKAKAHLNFLEMVRNIPMELVEQNPREVAQKIVSQYINYFK